MSGRGDGAGTGKERARRDERPPAAPPEAASSAEPTQPAEPEPLRAPEQEAPGLEPTPLKEELAAAKKRINDLAWALRAEQTEREEFKRRLTREREQLLDLERARVATALLETQDELDLCLKAASPDDPLGRGVRMIRESIAGRLTQLGLERMDVLGKPFDPNEHEAADMEITGVETDDQRVIGEVRAGYRLKDRLVRPARVKVARYVKPASA